MSSTHVGLARRLATTPASLLALVWIGVLIVGLMIIVPLVSPYTPTEQDLAAALQGPSAAHPLGTDNLGRDILTRLAYGSRITLTGAAVAALVAILLGSLMGLIAGHFRSWWDSVFTWVADILMSIPVLVILLSVAAVTSRSMTVLMLVLGVLYSASVYRIVRAATLNVRGELFITAARTSGLTDAQIIGRHELPRLLSLILVQATIVISLALVTQIGLGFLGLDTTPPDPSWGNMVKDASATIYTSLWPLIPPSVAVAVTVLAVSAIGDIAERSIGGRRAHQGLAKASRTRNPVHPASNPHAEGAVLAISGLTVAINKNGVATALVSDVTLAVMPGEIVGLVGESGAGKSVTARAALGILPADATATGSITVTGTRIIGASEKTLERLRGTRIAYISQEPMSSLSPSFRIGTQLTEIVRTHHKLSRKAAHARAIELLRTVHIPDPESVAKLYPHQISGGMAQRIMIGIALAGDPDILVADEPTTALDVSVQMQILDLLRQLQQERGLAVLIVTHDWGVVADVCDRAVAMYAGQIVEEAPLDAMFHRPLHPYSIALRASDPHAQSRRDRLSSIPGAVPPPGSWPTGCRFADRCEFATDACREETIALDGITDTHRVRCIRVGVVAEVTHV